MKDLERDKDILEYLLGAEFAVQRTGNNPLLWLAHPATSTARAFLWGAYNSDMSANFAKRGAIVSGSIPVVSSTNLGLFIGYFVNDIPGIFIGGTIGATIQFIISLIVYITYKDGLKIKAYKQAIDRKAPRPEKDEIIKIPKEYDYTEKLLDLPDFENINSDLTTWFQEAMGNAINSPEMDYLASHKGTPEQWVLYLELCRTGGTWDLKEYISPLRETPAQAGADWKYSFDGLEIPQDIFGNVFLGYIGGNAGMSEDSILIGAGIYQLKDHINEEIPQTDGEHGADISVIGDKETYQDDPFDNSALKAGYALFKKCGKNCSQSQIRETFVNLLNEKK